MRSVFLWRILVVLVITMLLASLLMTGGYMYLSRDTYTAIKLAELTPEAEAMGQIYIEHAQGALDAQVFTRLMDKLMQAADATGIVTDADGQPVYYAMDFSKFESPTYNETVDAQIRGALMGNSVENNAIPMADKSAALSVCVPVSDEQGNTVGSVFLLQTTAEIRRTTNRLNSSMILAVALVVPLMLLLSTFGVRRMMEPLYKMSQVAIEMSKGNFNVRADEDEPGEVGLLARALNNLCDTLSQIIHLLRAEKSQLRQILASLSEGVAATDSVGCLTIYNPALMHMFGAVRVGTRQELIPDPKIWDAFDGVYRTGKPADLHYALPGDRMLWITLTPVLSDNGARIGVVGLFKDMTEMENLERTRRDYVQNISHELRTPLTAMRGLLEPLADRMVTNEEDRQRYYKIMLREVLRLSRLITDMMELSRLQSGMEYMEFSEVDINEILEDVCLSYTKEAAQRGIRLELAAPKLPFVLTDPDRVEQILVILLSNAMRYTPPGGSIVIRGENCARVNISVSDTGCGIKEEDIEHVFDRFFTADKSRNEGNTGLGLSIAKQLADKLGEKIIVQSEVGKGACFCFTLKKYVSNAIALGPAQDEWNAVEEEGLEFFSSKNAAPPPEDAPYEILPEKKQKSGERRPGERKIGDRKKQK